MALPPRTYEGLTTSGKPIFSDILIASLNVFAIPLSACFKFSLINKFLDHAMEVDVDAISDGKDVYVAGIMQHIEEAGIHSGD